MTIGWEMTEKSAKIFHHTVNVNPTITTIVVSLILISRAIDMWYIVPLELGVSKRGSLAPSKFKEAI